MLTGPRLSDRRAWIVWLISWTPSDGTAVAGVSGRAMVESSAVSWSKRTRAENKDAAAIVGLADGVLDDSGGERGVDLFGARDAV
jgi:hypothetical protein